MTYPFRGLPGSTGFVPRPVLDVAVEHEDVVDVVALCDTGALHNRFGRWVADEAGLDLEDLRPEAIAVGGQHLLARTATLRLEIGPIAWEAPISFCEPWPWPYHLLGQEGFFRWFDVTIRAADRELDLAPIEV
ncbi:MAG: hypothetical protein JNK12_23475 [Acidimicrobiales bacterium]|nr:hypothetical protein [Acidimicrobiales bacterium]